MTYQPPGQQPHVDPAELRPGRAWYWIAGVVVVLGVCLGPGLALLGFASIAGDLPELKQEFGTGTATTVELTADTEWAIYVDNPDALSQGGDAPKPDVECTGEGGGIDISPSTANFDFPGDGGRHWQLLYDVSVDSDGSYQITCDSTDPELSDPRFAVGTAVNLGGMVGKVFGSLGALLGIPCLALVVGGVIALVAGLRRSSHKKRLLQERSGYPGTTAPGYPPGASGYPAPGGPGYPGPGASGYPGTGYPGPGASGYPGTGYPGSEGPGYPPQPPSGPTSGPPFGPASAPPYGPPPGPPSAPPSGSPPSGPPQEPPQGPPSGPPQEPPQGPPSGPPQGPPPGRPSPPA